MTADRNITGVESILQKYTLPQHKPLAWTESLIFCANRAAFCAQRFSLADSPVGKPRSNADTAASGTGTPFSAQWNVR